MMNPLENAVGERVQSHSEVTLRLQAHIQVILESVVGAQAKPYALLDFPDHANVGDSAIYMGEIAWLTQGLGMPPSYVCRYNVNRSELMRSLPDGTIFLHGGGNFGDIWPNHQNFREDVLHRCAGRPIVQLPQSIQYDDKRLIDRTAAKIAAHGAFTLLVRDRESYDLARSRFSCAVHLCPDMAFALGQLPRVDRPSTKVLLLLRTDKESKLATDARTSAPEGWQVDDWIKDEPNLSLKAYWETFRSMPFSSRSLQSQERRGMLFDKLAQYRVERGVSLISKAHFVITDRLHVHILCTLMGVPHAVLDNSYGKIGRFASAFGSMWEGATRVDTLAEAILAAKAAVRH